MHQGTIDLASPPLSGLDRVLLASHVFTIAGSILMDFRQPGSADALPRVSPSGLC